MYLEVKWNSGVKSKGSFSIFSHCMTKDMFSHYLVFSGWSQHLEGRLQGLNSATFAASTNKPTIATCCSLMGFSKLPPRKTEKNSRLDTNTICIKRKLLLWQFPCLIHFKAMIISADRFWVRPDSSLNVSTLYQLVPSPPIWKEREKTCAWKKKKKPLSRVQLMYLQSRREHNMMCSLT